MLDWPFEKSLVRPGSRDFGVAGSSSLCGFVSTSCLLRGRVLETDFLVQNLPDQPTKPMGNRPDSLIVSEARYQTAINHLEDTFPLVFTAALAAWLRMRRMGRLPLGDRWL